MFDRSNIYREVNVNTLFKGQRWKQFTTWNWRTIVEQGLGQDTGKSTSFTTGSAAECLQPSFTHARAAQPPDPGPEVLRQLVSTASPPLIVSTRFSNLDFSWINIAGDFAVSEGIYIFTCPTVVLVWSITIWRWIDFNVNYRILLGSGTSTCIVIGREFFSISVF